jgi:hypothetical protein
MSTRETQDPSKVTDSEPVARTRSGRVVKAPERYEPVEQVEDDYGPDDYDDDESDIESDDSFEDEDEEDDEDDADEDGKVSLDEFAAWYATGRLWKHGEALEGGGAKEALTGHIKEA